MELRKPAQFIEVYEEDHNPIVMVEANSDQDYGDEYDDQKSPSIKNFNEDGEMGDSQERQERLKIDLSDSNSHGPPMFKKQKVQHEIASGQDHSRQQVRGEDHHDSHSHGASEVSFLCASIIKMADHGGSVEQ
jgi:hypothetical protein